MKSSTKSILKYFIEFLIVAFGVFLAVYVSEWKSQKKIDVNTENTLTYIIEEITGNIGKLEESIKYQTSLIKDVDSLLTGIESADFEKIYYKQDKFNFNQLPNYQGFRFSNLEDIIFESAKINGVLQELNISTTQLIARLYQKQESYISFSERVVGKLINVDSKSTVADVLSIFELLKYDGLGTEKRLLEELKVAKEKLEKTKHNNIYKQ